MANLILALYVLTTSAGLIVLKLGTQTGTPTPILGERLTFNLNWIVFLGVLLYGVSFLLYVYLISRFELGYVIPVTAAFVYLLVFAASFFIFKETFTAVKVIGILLILAGLFFLNQSK